jgi:glucokinase
MYIGVDIGGTNIKYGIVDISGNIIFKDSVLTSPESGSESIINTVKNCISTLLSIESGVVSIGVGVPGVVDDMGVVRVAPNLQGWKNVGLKSSIRKSFNIPVAVDNDANAASLAELELGAGKELVHFIYVTLGTGVGGAIIYNRSIFRGSIGGAGEIGHTIIESFAKISQDDESWQRGTLESFAGRLGIINNAISLMKDTDINFDTFDVEEISKLAELGNAVAIKVFEITGEYLGCGLASAMNLLDIPIVVIGGGISQAPEVFYKSILNTIKTRSLPTISERAEIRKAKFSKDTGIIGAAMLGKNIAGQKVL